MGLDMFLNAKRYLWREDEKIAEDVSKLFHNLGDVRVKQVTAELMYWRKANAIHKWFVDNVQSGVDNCGEHFVSREKLEELLDVINRVLADRSLARTLLPPASGFFFGSTNIDDGYWDDLLGTKESLEKILDRDFFGWDIYYSSSW